MSDGYRHYWGLCETKSHPPILVQIEVHHEAADDATIADHEEWEDFGLRCPVCGDTVPGGFEGADNRTSETERASIARLTTKVLGTERLLTEARDLLLDVGLGSERVRAHLEVWAQEMLDGGDEGGGNYIISTADHRRILRIMAARSSHDGQASPTVGA